MAEPDWIRYQVFCITESMFVPSMSMNGTTVAVCPNNSTHQVNPDSIQELERRAFEAPQAVVNIVREELVPTGGNPRATSISVTAAAATQDVAFKSLPYPLTLKRASIRTTDAHAGSTVRLSINLDTNGGVLAQSAAITDSTLYVTQSVYNSSTVGMDVLLSDNNGPFIKVGRVIAKNIGLTALVLDTPLITSYTQGTLVALQYALIDDIVLGPGDTYSFNDNRVMGVRIPPNARITFTLTNPNSASATLHCYVDYLF